MSVNARALRTLARDLDGQPASVVSAVIALVGSIVKPAEVAERIRRADRALMIVNSSSASEKAIRKPKASKRVVA